MPGDVTVRLKVTEEVGSVLFVCGVKSVGGGVLYSVKWGGGGGGRLVVQYVPVRDREVGFPFLMQPVCVF